VFIVSLETYSLVFRVYGKGIGHGVLYTEQNLIYLWDYFQQFRAAAEYEIIRTIWEPEHLKIGFFLFSQPSKRGLVTNIARGEQKLEW
jgi:hypothetical protein